MSDTDRYPCVGVGLGVMGSAALYHLTRRGVRTLGVEKFRMGHNRGSSHGRSRAFRTTYDQELYARMACEALEMWRSLESDTHEELLHLVGMLAFAGNQNHRFKQNLAILRSLGLAHQVFDGREAARRFGVFDFGSDVVAMFAEKNGYLCADACIRAMQNAACARGGEIVEGELIQGVEPLGNAVAVRIGDRRILADQVILTVGPWVGHWLGDLKVPLKVTREQKVYFAVSDPNRFGVGQLPVFVDYDTGIYGFPIHGPGMKVAADHAGQTVDPDYVNRTVDVDYVGRLTGWINQWMPTAAPKPVESAVCLYTSTPDLDFIIDRHPIVDNVIMAGGFSGHGFKFAILVGDILADLAINGCTKRPIKRFRMARFVN